MVYIDDILLTDTDIFIIQQIIVSLQSEFMFKDLGRLEYFFGMEVTWTESGLLLTQLKYILDLLTKAKMTD